MAEMTFNINFDGYWREKNIDGIQLKSGIYCVYECTYNSKEETISVYRLIYIGEANNIRDRIKNHDKRDRWEKYVRDGNELCFSFGEMKAEHRNRVEAAFIFKHKPPANEEYKEAFPFDTTTINVTGKSTGLYSIFSVRTTPRDY